MDDMKNFAISAVATAPSPATTGASLVVTAGHGTRFPAVPFNAVVWPAAAQPLAANAEIVRVTGLSTDTMTITRTQESTSARTIVAGDQIAASVTAKLLTDLLPLDSVIPAATRIISNKLLAADAQPAFRQFGDGKMEFGPGGSTVSDVNLYRLAANVLQTNDEIRAVRSTADATYPVGFASYLNAEAYPRFAIFSYGELTFSPGSTGGDTLFYRTGPGLIGITAPASGIVTAFGTLPGGQQGVQFQADTNLYRSAADLLKTDDTFAAALSVFANYGTAGQVSMSYVGGAPGIYFGNAYDTNLYRAAAEQLKTDGYFFAGKSVYGWQGAAPQVVIGSSDGTVTGNASIAFGSTGDTNLYRVGAGYLKTDGGLLLNGGVYIDQDDDGSRLYFGSAQDTNLYRSAVDNLKTDDNFTIAGMLDVQGSLQAKAPADAYAKWGVAGNSMQFGSGTSALDVLVGRSASGYLTVHPSIVIDVFGTGGRAYFGSGANDTWIEKNAAGQLGFSGGLYIRAAIQFYTGNTNASFLAARVTGDTQARIAMRNTGSFDLGPGGSSSADTFITRTGSGTLGIQNSLNVDGADLSGKLTFGSASDANLYRNAASTLKSDHGLWAVGGLVTKTKAGTPTDVDLVAGMAQSGAFILDTTASKIWFRVGSTWKGVVLT